jgi:hypothetical protein
MREATDAGQHGHPLVDQFHGQPWQPVIVAMRPAIFDGNVLAFDEPQSPKPCRNAARRCMESAGDRALMKPITGIAPCCARAASGHATAAPPISVMNSRRLMLKPFPA